MWASVFWGWWREGRCRGGRPAIEIALRESQGSGVGKGSLLAKKVGQNAESWPTKLATPERIGQSLHASEVAAIKHKKTQKDHFSAGCTCETARASLRWLQMAEQELAAALSQLRVGRQSVAAAPTLRALELLEQLEMHDEHELLEEQMGSF